MGCSMHNDNVVVDIVKNRSCSKLKPGRGSLTVKLIRLYSINQNATAPKTIK